MTKSQNTKNEQHCIKQNEKSFIQKDLSLTELLKKGELLDGTYYVKLNWDNIITTLFYSLANGFENDDHFYDEDEIAEVLAPVPSYDEYQKLLSDQLAKIEGEEIVAELEYRLAMVKANGKYPDRISRLKSRVVALSEENAQLKTEYEKECRRADELEDSYWKAEKENLQLKELLKECQKSIHWYQEAYGAMDLDTYTLLAKLNEALQ